MFNKRETLNINKSGNLQIGGIEAAELAKKYGTPLYVFDEKHIRDMCRVYKDTLKNSYGDSRVLYASKAFSCLAIYRILMQEGIGADVVSEGELYTALSAGFPASDIFFHGNNKLKSELEYAIQNKVGVIVADALSEIDLIDKIAAKHGITQDILLRVNPGVEAHTHHYIQTARTDSKFGFSLGGCALEAAELAISKKNIKLRGLHCHIGSQIFEQKPFYIAADSIIKFYLFIKDKYGAEFDALNMGGGVGIWYGEGDNKMTLDDYAGFAKGLSGAVISACEKYSIKKPKLYIEPGRSLIGEAGITLYTVGAIKDIAGVKKYVSVDGGMFENPRFALYQAKYTAVLANDTAQKAVQTVTISGKCCESGDIICEGVKLPEVKSGDILAVFSTGAYNYSMASNYNRNKIPPAVLCHDGESHYIIKPQTNEDLIRNDLIPAYLK